MSSRSAHPAIPRQRRRNSSSPTPPPPGEPPSPRVGRHRANRRRPVAVLLRTLSLFLVALCTGAVLVPTSQVGAAVIPDAITDVEFAQGTVTQTQTMRLDLTFHIGAGIDHPGGTAQEGDTFALQLDPRLEAQTSGFAIYNPENTAKVADVTIDADGLATFTLTDYVESRTATDGSAFWATNFRDENIPVGDTTLIFTSGPATWEGNVTIVDSPPGAGGIVPPFKGGSWLNGTQTQGRWNIYLPAGPMDRIVLEDDRSSTGGPGWEFDCTSAMTRDLAGGTEVDFQCSPDYLRWEIVDVPAVSVPEQQPQFGIAFNVTDTSPAGDLIVENQATYVATYQNQVTDNDLYVYLQRTRGGVGQGGTVPISPSVVQSECDGTHPTVPVVTPAQNGGGVTYSIEGTVAAGETVQVIGTLSPGYSWDAPMTDGWLEQPNGTVSYEIVLTRPNCSVTTTPTNPDVVQSSCAGPGDVTPPSVTLPADTAGITYGKTGDEIPGGTVTVTATLATGYQWDTLPDGWTASTDNRSATWTVTLTDVDCTVETVPTTPEIIQSECFGPGNPTQPAVNPADDTAAITYTKSGSEIPGSTVVVTATLTDGYTWGTLPDGWLENADHRSATFTAHLNDIDCTVATTPADPNVTLAACAGPGDVTPPTVVLPADADGITYGKTGDETPGGTVTVTATLATGYQWGTLPDGWTASTDNRSATWTITLDNIDCTVTTTPVDPAVTQASCAGPGDTTPPAVTPADDANGITYTKSGDEAPGGTVTITATLANGFNWGVLPDGWTTSTDNRSATWTITVDNIDCIVPTTPTAPNVTGAVCTTPGTLTPPMLSLPQDTDSITYRSSGEVIPGGTVTVIATLADGYRWADLTDGWTATADGAEYLVTFQDVSCSAPTPPTTTPTATTPTSTPSPSAPSSTPPATMTSTDTTVPTTTVAGESISSSPATTERTETSVGTSSSAPPVVVDYANYPNDLANTGASAPILPLAGIGLASLFLGGLLMLGFRRRNRSLHHRAH